MTWTEGLEMRAAPPSPRSTAAARRPDVVAAAVQRFAEGGWTGTTYADVAAAAGISTGYVAKLFPSKELLFVAALDDCFDRIVRQLEQAGAASEDSPDRVLQRLGDAYAHLISDRAVLMMQVHAQSVAAVPAIGDALREGLRRITTHASEVSGADDDAVQRFMAYGQLCHLVVMTGLDAIHEPWANTLSHGIRHYEVDGSAVDRIGEGSMSAPTAIDDTAPVIARHEQFIAAPLTQVWDLHVQIASWPQWQPDITGLESDQPVLHAGGWFTWSSGGLDIRTTVYRLDAEAHETLWGGPAQGVTAVHRWHFTPDGDGTRVATEESWSGPAVEADVPAAQQALDASLRHWLELLTRRAEAR